jgi:hypothetical protein
MGGWGHALFQSLTGAARFGASLLRAFISWAQSLHPPHPHLPAAAHASHLAAVDVSPDSAALLAVGKDARARQAVALWDISRVRDGGAVRAGGCSGWAV